MPDRGAGAARRRPGRLPSRRVDGAEGTAQGRRLHPVRRRRRDPGPEGRELGAPDLRGRDRDRRADRFGHRRPAGHRRRRRAAAREGPAPSVAVLHSRPTDQSGQRPGVDHAQAEGPQPFRRHRLLDGGPRHRRRGASGRARRRHDHGRGRRRIGLHAHWHRRLRGLPRTYHGLQRHADQGLATRTATAS